MNPERQYLLDLSRTSGFRAETLEKVLRLLDLLNDLAQHPMLQRWLVLKGGTALNLFELRMPRLSVDIDLNYIATPDPQIMIQQRPALLSAIEAIFRRNNLTTRRAPKEHAGGKWVLRYQSAIDGQGANLDVDINFMYRMPLFPIRRGDSQPIGDHQAKQIPLLNLDELIAGKLCALFGRNASRDLFDAHEIFQTQSFDVERVRLAFIVYGAAQRKDWRKLSLDDVAINPTDAHQQLLPVLRAQRIPQELAQWLDAMLYVCHSNLAIVLPFRDNEREFLDRLLDHAEIRPELLTNDQALIDRILRNPGLEWKALNVRKHKGPKDDDSQ